MLLVKSIESCLLVIVRALCAALLLIHSRSISRFGNADNSNAISTVLLCCFTRFYTANTGFDELYATVNLTGNRPTGVRLEGNRVSLLLRCICGVRVYFDFRRKAQDYVDTSVICIYDTDGPSRVKKDFSGRNEANATSFGKSILIVSIYLIYLT
jgi:hypothetical protein